MIAVKSKAWYIQEINSHLEQLLSSRSIPDFQINYNLLEKGWTQWKQWASKSKNRRDSRISIFMRIMDDAHTMGEVNLPWVEAQCKKLPQGAQSSAMNVESLLKDINLSSKFGTQFPGLCVLRETIEMCCRSQQITLDKQNIIVCMGLQAALVWARRECCRGGQLSQADSVELANLTSRVDTQMNTYLEAMAAASSGIIGSIFQNFKVKAFSAKGVKNWLARWNLVNKPKGIGGRIIAGGTTPEDKKCLLSNTSFATYIRESFLRSKDMENLVECFGHNILQKCTCSAAITTKMAEWPGAKDFSVASMAESQRKIADLTKQRIRAEKRERQSGPQQVVVQEANDDTYISFGASFYEHAIKAEQKKIDAMYGIGEGAAMRHAGLFHCTCLENSEVREAIELMTPGTAQYAIKTHRKEKIPALFKTIVSKWTQEILC